jgi:hypothetical protein
MVIFEIYSNSNLFRHRIIAAVHCSSNLKEVFAYNAQGWDNGTKSGRTGVFFQLPVNCLQIVQ